VHNLSIGSSASLVFSQLWLDQKVGSQDGLSMNDNYAMLEYLCPLSKMCGLASQADYREHVDGVDSLSSIILYLEGNPFS
jgi:hypothetical protein